MKLDQASGKLERIMIEHVRVGDKLLSYDHETQKPFYDDVILVNNHEYDQTGVVSTVRLFFSDDDKDFIELTHNHFALVLGQNGTYVER